MDIFKGVVIGLVLLTLSACGPLLGPRADQYKYQKPRIAVLEFENKASLSTQWKLSEGMRDMLVDALVKTDRYVVLTRNELGAVISELEIQSDPRFRQQGKLEKGKLKNVQYLIKGAVTDFTPNAKGGALRAFGSTFGIGASGSIAVVSVTLYVIDVETGEIVASKTMDGTASSSTIMAGGEYKNIALGGKAFFRTPLGEATQEVMDQCLAYISDAIASKTWNPAVVRVEGNQIYVSGGKDRKISPGSEWSAYVEGEKLIDPQTGDELGKTPGHLSGRLRIVDVQEKFSIAEAVDGTFAAGQSLRPADKLPETATGRHDKL